MADLTALGTIAIESRTVFGNKRIVIGTIVFGDASDTWPSGGLPFVPSQINLEGIDWMNIDQEEQMYFYDKANNKIDAFVVNATPGAAVINILAVASVPTAAAVRFMAVGYGG